MQLAFLLWAARVALPPALHCQVCDTSYYYTAAAEIAKSGLLFLNPYDGYRSYFVPFFIASVQSLAATAGFEGGAVERYTYGVTLLFWLVSSGLMWWLAKRVGLRTFWMTSAATLLNPILLVYVPFALQEGVLMVCCLPLLFVWAGAKDMKPSRRAALVMMLALLAYIRSYRGNLCRLVAVAADSASSPLAAMDGFRCLRWLPPHRTPNLYFESQIRLLQSLSVDHAPCPANRLGRYVTQVRNGRRRRALAWPHLLVAVRGGARGGQDRRFLPQAPDARRVSDVGPRVCRLSL